MVVSGKGEGNGAEPQTRSAFSAFFVNARALAGRLADTIVPPVCLACQAPLSVHHALCPECWCQIDFIRAPLCDRLGLPLPFDTGGVMISAAAAVRVPLYHRARAVASYDGVMRQLIHRFKYHDRHDIRRLFGGWLLQAGHELLDTADVIVPVPLNRLRLLKRRFNQAAILGGELSRRSGVKHSPMVLHRVRATRSQVGLTHAQRRQNVRGAFVIAPMGRSIVQGRRVLLVDDVVTTGATVEACAKVLLDAGAVAVDVLALALVTEPERMTT
ncbi:ComF family protein [Filomicrobium sp.]|uniref:ComF family protein n=1 Tax=Filomicrobium sp. TaxID=2024831 RepID=UPI00258D04A3|nr:ComF family protein [Filomicrobium sp.]MCV0370707.1 ComF family protein [Filomicrobium sp.]